MIKRAAILLFSVLLPLSLQAKQFEEGTHYDVISEQTSSRPEVKEYFSFYCGGCNAFEPVAQSLAANLPENTEFKKVHVDFLRAASPDIQNMLARAYLVAKKLDKGNEVASAIFNQIHSSRIPFTTENDIRSLVLLHGIDGETYDKAIKSFSIMGAAKKMKKEQEELSSKRILSGVPMLIVNGKYKINNAALDNRNLQAEMQQLIDYLLKKDDIKS